MSQPTNEYNVAIVDDHELFANALSRLLKDYKFMHVRGIFNTGQKMLDNFEKIKPDIVFMDIMMPEMDGIEATKLIMQKYPNTKVIAISSYDEGIQVKRMFKAGACSFVTKDITRKIFKDVITSITKNSRYVSSAAAVNYTLYTSNKIKLNEPLEADASSPLREPEQIPDITMTPREKEIIKYLMKGYSHKEIADAISRSARTIDTHKQNIMEKLNTHKSNEIVALALKYKLI